MRPTALLLLVALAAGAPTVTIQSVSRIVDGKMVGTGTLRLADRPDSVVMRFRSASTKQP